MDLLARPTDLATAVLCWWMLLTMYVGLSVLTGLFSTGG